MNQNCPYSDPSHKNAQAPEIRQNQCPTSRGGLLEFPVSSRRQQSSIVPFIHLLREDDQVTSEPQGRQSMKSFPRITFDPAVMGGKACIRGLRVAVGTVVGLLAAGRSPEDIVKAYPYLDREDIEESLAYAAWRLEEREVPLPI